MSDTSPATGVRPTGAPVYEPVVRRGALPVGGTTGRLTHPVLFPDGDADDDAPIAAPPGAKRGWYRAIVRPAAFIAAGLGAGVVLGIAVYGLLNARSASSGNRAGADSAPAGAVLARDTAVLDRKADTLALAISAFTLRAGMYDSRRMACAGLARGLQQVEDGWVAYNIARKETLAAPDAARDARDRSLYADVRAVELRFERSSCARP